MSKLVAMIEARLEKSAPPARPALRLVKPSPARGRLDSISRDSHLRMIRHLNRRYRLQMLVDQATFGRAGLEQLDDDELVRLHEDLHRAYECAREGISWEDAGLVRDVAAEHTDG